MNENKDSFGLDQIQPLDAVSKEPVNSSVFSTNFYTEPVIESQEERTQFAFTPEDFVMPEVPTMSSVEMPVTESNVNSYVQMPIIEPTNPIVEPVPTVDATVEEPVSFMEMPTAVEQPMVDVVNEHPNAVVSLHKTEVEETVVSNLPEEKIDKGTIWMLVSLFLIMLLVIIALPYFL